MFKILKKYQGAIWAAVAEIVIVFVGISISLSIDDWREESGNRELEDVYLKELYFEINEDLTRLTEKINWIDEVRFRVSKVINFMHFPDSLIVSDQDMKIAIGKAFILVNFVSKDYTFSDLTNTGNIKLIFDQKIRKKIYSYYSLVKNISNLENINNKTSTDILTNDLMRAFPLRQLFDYTGWYDGIEKLTELDLAFLRLPDSEKYIRLESALLLRLSLLRFEQRGYSQCSEQAYFLRDLIGEKLNLPNEKKFIKDFNNSEKSIENLLAEYKLLENEFVLLETPVNNMAYELLDKKPKKALELFLYNTINYPFSANVWDSAGDGYLKNGNKKKALEMFLKALELNPGLKETKEKIEQLR